MQPGLHHAQLHPGALAPRWLATPPVCLPSLDLVILLPLLSGLLYHVAPSVRLLTTDSRGMCLISRIWQNFEPTWQSLFFSRGTAHSQRGFFLLFYFYLFIYLATVSLCWSFCRDLLVGACGIFSSSMSI